MAILELIEQGATEEEAIKIAVEQMEMTKSYAEFVLAMEMGKIDGDVMDENGEQSPINTIIPIQMYSIETGIFAGHDGRDTQLRQDVILMTTTSVSNYDEIIIHCYRCRHIILTDASEIVNCRCATVPVLSEEEDIGE